MGKSPKKSKNLSKLPQSQGVDLVNLYSRLNELSKEELVILKQQLIDQQKAQLQPKNVQNNQQTVIINNNLQSQNMNTVEQRGKSKKKKKDNINVIASGDEIDMAKIGIINQQNSKLFVMAASASVESHHNNGQVSTKNSKKPSKPNEFHNSQKHHLDSVNIYLQSSSAGKKINKQIKKRRNLDLMDVCNESTILGKSKIEETVTPKEESKHLQSIDEFNQMGNSDANSQQDSSNQN